MKYLILLLALICVTLSSCTSDDMVDGENPVDQKPVIIDDNYVYNLPVIFHVIYNDASDPTQYVPVKRLQTILNNVNDLWHGDVYGQSVNTNVKFKLADTDEEGKKLDTPGVEYIKWTGSYPIDEYEIMGDNTRKYVKYIWDPNKYINVMVYNFKQEPSSGDIVLGISHLPFTVEGDSALAGLDTVTVNTISKNQLQFAYCSSINSTYINDESTRYTLPDKGANGYQYLSTDVNVTVAHELCHYLGLYHTFAEENTENGTVYANSCFDSDYCQDTPSYNRIEYEQFLIDYISQHQNNENINIMDLLARRNCDGQSFYSTNIMDYYINEGFQITPEQLQRIRTVLYYSPLIPGEKKHASSRASIFNEPLNLRVRYVK